MESTLCQAMEKEITFLKKLQTKIAREVKRLPEGRLEVGISQRRYVQYHVVSQKDGKEVRSYIPKENVKLAEQLAQRAYDGRLARNVKKRCKAMERALEVVKNTNPLTVYDRESPERRKLITPLVSTDEQYIEQWYEEHKGGQNSFAKTTAYTTVKGETVRSKSEKMIADAYHAAGVPYVYEPTVMLSNGKTKYPDFAVLNVRLRKTMYHEHFGMMDDDEYRQNAMLKIREYNKNGYPIGDCLLCTFEGENIPFDQDELNELIRVFFL